MALVRAGRVREAEADARLSFEFKLRHSPLPALLWSLYPARRRAHRARRARRAPTPPSPQPGARRPAGGRAGRAAAAAEPRAAAARPAPPRGRPRRSLRRGRRAGREFGMPHPGFASWRVDAAEALVALGEPAEARRLAEEHLAARRAPRPARPARRRAARARPHRGSRRARSRCSTAPSTLLAGSPAQLEHTRALVDLGAALRRANRRADAREPLRRALDLAERGGMRLLARRARDELHAAGARPRRAALTGPHALTAGRAPRRAARRGGALQPRDRRAALRHPAHRRDAPHARLPEARHPRACRASRRARRERRRPRTRAGLSGPAQRSWRRHDAHPARRRRRSLRTVATVRREHP